MKAIGYSQNGPLETANFTEFETTPAELGPHDLLIDVKGVSLNPVDTKVRTRAAVEGEPKILGYDAAGTVLQTGSDVSLFKVGDHVFYAGDITRPGTNAQHHVVDERIVAKKPESLDFAEAAGIPLTAITAWELLFDSLGLKEGDGEGESLLIIAGAGGVGSILIQLAKKLTKLNVIATASRDETIDWVKKMGADHVINHRHPLDEQLAEMGIKPKYVAALSGTDDHFQAILNLTKPRGTIAFIDDPSSLDIMAGKQKALRFSWEFMFTRPMFQTEDIIEQHKLLSRVSTMLDQGELISTVTQNLGPLSVENIIKGHKLQESGRMIGKNVLSGLA